MKKKIIQIIGLILFLIVLPVGSWYYLKAGFDYHKEALQELEMLGEVKGEHTILPLDGQEKRISDFQGNLIIAANLRKEDDNLVNKIARLKEQFEDREDVYLVAFLETSNDSAFSWNDRIKGTDLAGHPRFLGLELKNSKNQQFKDTFFEFEKYCQSEPCEMLAFVDSKSQIRQYYNVADSDRMKRLVEHTAILLPKKKVGKPKVVRETEK